MCKPPIDRIRVDATPGTTWRVSCNGRSASRKTTFHAAGADTYVGAEKVRVGDELVPAYHYSVNRALTGSQSGYERYDIWYSVVDALPLRIDRRVNVKSPSPIGDVNYSENGSLDLTSLTPRR